MKPVPHFKHLLPAILLVTACRQQPAQQHNGNTAQTGSAADTVEIKNPVTHILPLLPDSAFATWAWPRSQRAEFAERFNATHAIPAHKSFSQVLYLTLHVMQLRVVDGLWTMAIYKHTAPGYTILVNDAAGGYNHFRYYTYNEGKLTPADTALISRPAYALLRNNSPRCIAALYQCLNVARYNYRYKEDKVGIKLPADYAAPDCLKADTLTLYFNPQQRTFTTQ